MGFGDGPMTTYEMPRLIYDEDGKRLVACAGGCGTYIDELDIYPFCVRCRTAGASCDAEPEPVLHCWCGLEMRSKFGFAYGHVGKRRPGDTHPASTRRPRRRKVKERKTR